MLVADLSPAFADTSDHTAAPVVDHDHWPVWEDVVVSVASGILHHIHPHIAEPAPVEVALPPAGSHCIAHCNHRTVAHTLDRMPAAHNHRTAALDTRIHSAQVVLVVDDNMLDVEVRNESSHRTPF